MSKIITFLKSLFVKTEDEFTKLTHLPVGVTEFHQWADSIIAKTGFTDVKVLKMALCRSIVQLGPDVHKVPKEYFVAMLHKAASNQIAFAVQTDIQTEIKAAQQAAASEAAKLSEAVAAPTTPSGQS